MSLLSSLYGTGLSWKRFIWKNPHKLSASVISFGNLTLGGTGKTPAVISAAREAKKRGYVPCILTRGYRGKTKDIRFVSKGDRPLLGPLEAGDEAHLMAATLKGIPVVKGKNRYEAGLFALDFLKSEIKSPESNIVFFLDDGFQHWKLHRNVDVLLIDGTNPFGNEKLFPEGILREPFSAMKRAHIIVITKTDMVPEGAITSITHRVKQYNHEAPIFTASHKPAGLVTLTGDTRGLDGLCKKRIYVFAGIANPSYFQSTLISAGARTVEFRKFRDHHRYRQKDMDEIKADASDLDIVTTEKDLVKLKGLDIPENLSALKIDFFIDNEFYDYLFGIISSCPQR